MLASFSISEDSSTVTVQLPNNKKIVGTLDLEQNIHILQNDMNISEPLAECVAGIAYSSFREQGDDVMVWNRLLDMANKCRKYIDQKLLNLN